MATQRTGNLKLIQELNRSIILNTVREHGPISRSEIAKRIKVSPTTVTSAINELMKLEIVTEGELGVSNGGRKPILVQLLPNSRFIICVSITNTMVTLGEVNLDLKVLKKQKFIVGDTSGDALISYVLVLIGRFLDSYASLERCLGISIIAPGIVDYESGNIVYNSKLMLKDLPLKQIVENRFNITAWLSNDTNAVALAEKKTGEYKDYNSLVYITVDDGVGASFILNNVIYSGRNGGAGELGHIIIERGGIQCECGNRGCLATYVSWDTVFSKVITSAERNETLIKEMVNGELLHITPSILIEAARLKDQLAIDVLSETASYLSTGIINLVNLLNPDIVILGGKLSRENSFLISKVNQLVMDQGLKTNTEQLKICSSSLGDESELIGAANIVLHDKFEFTLN